MTAEQLRAEAARLAAAAPPPATAACRAPARSAPPCRAPPAGAASARAGPRAGRAAAGRRRPRTVRRVRVDLFDFDLAARPDRAEAGQPARLRAAAAGRRRRDLAIMASAICRACCARGDVLVFNDTRVIPAQLEGRRGEARIGATLHKREGPRAWRAFVRNAKRLRDGDRIDFGAGVAALASERGEDGSFLLTFDGEEPVELLLERAGRMPLPPYIAGKRAADARDRDDYQTMFAREEGAVAAPTAALHFTPALMAALGRGRHRPRDADPPCRRRHLPAGQGRRHGRPCHARRMGPDRRRDAAARLNAARAAGGRIIAVGTTSLRLLESAADEAGRVQPVRRRHRDLHHPRLPLPRGRRPDHQLPSAALDPVHAGLGADGAWRRCRRPMPMRSRRATASIPMAMPACCCPEG